MLNVDVGSNPGVFGGVIQDGSNGTTVGLNVECPYDGDGMLLTLTGRNAYSVGTISDGTLQVGDGTHNGSITGQVNVTDGIIFDVAANTTQTFNGTIIDSASEGFLLTAGAGTLVLNGDNAYQGATGVEDGTLQLGSDNVLPAGTNLTIDGGVLDLGNHQTPELATVTLEDGSIWEDGPGTQGTQQSPGKLVCDSFTTENGNVTANQSRNAPSWTRPRGRHCAMKMPVCIRAARLLLPLTGICAFIDGHEVGVGTIEDWIS